MTAFNTSDIPATIDTVEKLSAWCSQILNNLYFDVTTLEASNEATLVAQSAPFQITVTDPMEWRLISRQSIKLSPNWQRTGKLWEHAQPIGNSSIPVDMKS